MIEVQEVSAIAKDLGRHGKRFVLLLDFKACGKGMLRALGQGLKREKDD